MLTILKGTEVLRMLSYVADQMIAQEKYFCILDSKVGDGDHGVTIRRGFCAAKHILEQPAGSMEEMFRRTGKAMTAEMGGAIGPIYGMIFDGFARAVKEKDGIDGETAARMMVLAAQNVAFGAEVEEGDKTLYDALAPAAYAMKRKAGEGAGLYEIFCAGAAAARDGAERTCVMIARKGRARFLKEKSIGCQDAGAGSMAVLIEAMKEYIGTLSDPEKICLDDTASVSGEGKNEVTAGGRDEEA